MVVVASRQVGRQGWPVYPLQFGGLGGSESCPTGQTSLQQQSQPGACMSSLSKLNRIKLRLSPHCDWSACLHQHFFCTCIFNPTRPFFMLSNRGHQAATASHPLGNWLQSLLHHFPHQTCLAPQGALYPCTMTFQPPPARSYSQPDCHKQDLGSMGTVSDSKPSSGRTGHSSPICLGLCKWHFRGVPVHLESMSQWDMQRRLNISGLVSLFISNFGA